MRLRERRIVARRVGRLFTDSPHFALADTPILRRRQATSDHVDIRKRRHRLQAAQVLRQTSVPTVN